jgi:hypothetical protein
MKILFINPVVRYFDEPRHVPLGMLQLMGILERDHPKVKFQLYDANAFRIDNMETGETKGLDQVLSAEEFDVIAIGGLIIGTLMYLIEGDQSGFTSIPRGVYWAIVTLTTVGYGDIAPQSAFGQFLASMVMILGYGIIAIPTGIVTSEFTKLGNKDISLNTQSCPNCSAENHRDGAEFCYNCGNRL